MAIGDVRLQDPSDQPQGQSPNETTSPAQGLDEGEHKDKNEEHDQVQEESNDQGGDEDDGDKEGSNSRAKPPHPSVHHTVQKDHPVNDILGDIEKGITTRSHVANFYQYYSFVSSFEPFKVEDALRDLDWVVAMQEELNNFKHNEVWFLVGRLKQNIVGTKWMFRNKQDKHGVMTRNKARLVA
jgi:cobalamin biosynthesis protein CobT